MGEILLRFAFAGMMVAIFSVVGEVLKPKRFAGVFGAAPAVALPSLVLTFVEKGADDAAIIGRSMIAGGAGFLLYSLVVSLMLDHVEWPGWVIATVAWLVWFAVAFGIWGLFLR